MKAPKYFRKHFCWLVGHRYPVIWFKSEYTFQEAGDQTGIADTEAGCTYCDHTEPNWYPMKPENIDWERTTHRTEPPRFNVYPWEKL